MKLTYLGHATLSFEFGNSQVLLDPFISHNPLAKDIDIQSLKPDYIFLTHAHGDHVADMAAIQKNAEAQVAAIVETAAWVERQGVPAEKIIQFNMGGTVKTSFGEVKMVYALHSNSTPDGQYGGTAAGYVFTVADKKIYVAGDTALTLEMKLLASLNLDYAILPIGGHFTMGVDDAIIAADLINCKQIIGVHFDTFPPISIDHQEAIAKFKAAGLNLTLPKVGESIAL